MTLETRQIALVQDSFRKVRQQLEPGDTRFYDRLFRAHPEMRPMFRDDIAGQGMKFMSTLAVIVDALTTPQTFSEEVTELAEGHAALGVKAKDYAPLGDALFDTFRDILGDDYTQEVDEAWRAAYALIAAQMIARGGLDGLQSLDDKGGSV